MQPTESSVAEDRDNIVLPCMHRNMPCDLTYRRNINSISAQGNDIPDKPLWIKPLALREFTRIRNSWHDRTISTCQRLS